uniref:Cas1_AcylT domain-containing protein n=1 Tax=Caenorhabditis tropicalis TaxID=1561998 RepID=A0A1I7UGI7_9PELO
MISVLTGLYILPGGERFTKKQSICIMCITIFHFIFLFNPWIAEYQKEAEEFYIIWHYTITIYYVHFFCCLLIVPFICWLPWQNQSMRKKPKYKVIYGGNDTKKMPVDSESV